MVDLHGHVEGNKIPLRQKPFFPPSVGILAAIAVTRGMRRAADGIQFQIAQETHKPSIDLLWAMEMTMRHDVRAAYDGIVVMVPTTREEAYARCDLLLERAVAEGSDYADIRELVAEAERQVAVLPEQADLP